MNKLLIITGGSRGIGKAIVEKFASKDFDVITTGRNKEHLEKLQANLKEVYPGINCDFIVSDLSKKQDVEAFGIFVKSKNRTINILVNNAGVYMPGQIYTEPEGQLEQMIETNLYSAYYTTREFVPIMIKSKSGHVFTICSTASIIPYVNGGSYCISKFALLGMTKVLREEMKPYGIKVTAILPGPTKTDSWKGVDYPNERFISPEEIGEIIFNTFSLSNSAVVEEIIIRPQLGDIV